MYRKLNINKLANRGFIAVVVILGLIVLVQGVGAALGFIDKEHEIVWRPIAKPRDQRQLLLPVDDN